jgi:membrane protein
MKQQLLQWYAGLNHRTHGWLGVFVEAIGNTFKSDTSITAAAIAYFALFSLFPAILVSIYIASFNINPLLNQQFILNRLDFIAPALGKYLASNIQQIIKARGSVTIVALVALVWSASSVFNMLNQTMSDLWGQGRSLPMWERRGLAVLLVLIFAGPVLVFLSFGGSLLAVFYNLLPVRSTLLTWAVGIVVAIVLDVALFFLFYRLFPHGLAKWRELLPGAIIGGILWELAKRVFLVFVSSYLSTSNLVYGSVAAVIAFLLWAYLSGLIFLCGAYLNLAFFTHKHSEQDEVKVW